MPVRNCTELRLAEAQDPEGKERRERVQGRVLIAWMFGDGKAGSYMGMLTRLMAYGMGDAVQRITKAICAHCTSLVSKIQVHDSAEQSLSKPTTTNTTTSSPRHP